MGGSCPTCSGNSSGSLVRPSGAGLGDDECRRLAWEIVTRASREEPADQLLRRALARPPVPAAAARRTVSELVFAFFRWRGWLAEAADPSTLERAMELDQRFQRTPHTFTDAELRRCAVPRWIEDCQGKPPVAWLRALQDHPRVWLRARIGQGAKLAARLGFCREGGGRLRDALCYCGREDLFRTAAFHEGAFELQDLSSQAVGWVCAPQPGAHWWDVCAGEGGKTLHLAEQMQNRGVVWATDRAEWRLRSLRRRAARAGLFNIRPEAWTGSDRPPGFGAFDGVLVDAPCSGTGTWQRNPHARWTAAPEDVTELAAVQSGLLRRASAAVKPGGRLVYAVCSLTMDETCRVADDFESDHPAFEPETVVDPTGIQARAARLWLRTERCGGNGMFVAVWRRARG